MERQDDRLRRLIPIPTYEEATSRPSSSLGPTHISDDAERQRLTSNHRRPTVEDARDSLDSDLSVPDMVDEEGHERRQIEELDYMGPGEAESTQSRLYHRARIRSKAMQRLWSALRIPSLRRRYAPVDSGDDPPQNTTRTRWHFPTIPEQYRMSVPTLARLCALFTIIAAVYLLFALDFFPSALREHSMMATVFDPDSVRNFVQEQVDTVNIRENAEHLASYAHVAGSRGDYRLSVWVHETWKRIAEFEDSEIAEFTIAADYPSPKSSVEIINPPDNSWRATMEEVPISDLKSEQEPLAWHAYSATGTVEGPVVYANGGSKEDWAALHSEGIVTNGTIAMLRSDLPPTNAGMKIYLAEEAGCVGVIIFDGDKLSGQSSLLFPLPGNDTIHRDNAVMRNWVLGDFSEASNTNILPKIPSVAMSWHDAKHLLSKIKTGHLHSIDGNGLQYTGNATSSNWPEGMLVVRLNNENEKSEDQRLYNVHALMKGAENPAHHIIIGAHRDSWCFGASGAGFSTAVLTEVVKIFGNLRKQDWLPLRTIEFVSWDGFVYNSAGSTKYVEKNAERLQQMAVAYLDVGMLAGAALQLQGSPLLRRALKHSMDRITSPEGNATLRALYDGRNLMDELTPFSPITADGDAAPFANIIGVPGLKMDFSDKTSAYIQGSCYDTYDRMVAFSPGYDLAMAQLVALVVLDLASAPLLPLDITTYAESIHDWIDKLDEQAQGKLDTGSLHSRADELKITAETFHAFEEQWTNRVLAGGGVEDLFYHHSRATWNNRAAQFDKHFIDDTDPKDQKTRIGLKERPQYKHLLHAPERWGDGVEYFPSIVDLLNNGDIHGAQEEVERIAEVVRQAGDSISDD